MNEPCLLSLRRTVVAATAALGTALGTPSFAGTIPGTSLAISPITQTASFPLINPLPVPVTLPSTSGLPFDVSVHVLDINIHVLTPALGHPIDVGAINFTNVSPSQAVLATVLRGLLTGPDCKPGGIVSGVNLVGFDTATQVVVPPLSTVPVAFPAPLVFGPSSTNPNACILALAFPLEGNTTADAILQLVGKFE